MALPKKGLRKIAVGNCQYAWSATGNDGWLALSIAPLSNAGPLLKTGFGYHSEIVGVSHISDGHSVAHCRQRLLLTPYIVRQVIEYALESGWNPQEKGRPFNLPNLEDKLDLRLLN